MSKQQGMNKQIMRYPYGGILVSSVKERTTKRHDDMDESQNYYAERKKSDTRGQAAW